MSGTFFPGRDTFSESAAHLRIAIFGIRTWSRRDIFLYFSQFGTIKGISDVSPKGFAFVQFKYERSVLDAIREMDSRIVRGARITVRPDRKRFKKRDKRKYFTNRLDTYSVETSMNASYTSTFEDCARSCPDVKKTDDLNEQNAQLSIDSDYDEAPMDICIEESQSDNSTRSDSTFDLSGERETHHQSSNETIETVDTSTQTLRRHASPQWLCPSAPIDCLVAQMVGTENYGENVKRLLNEVGIRCADLFFENLSDAENPMIEYIEDSPDIVYGIFICDSDMKESTISVLSDSKLTKNLPLAEAIESLQKHFEAIKLTAWNKFRIMKFFLNPMISTLDGLLEEDLQFAMDYVSERNRKQTQKQQHAISERKSNSGTAQARHDVPVFGQT